jgi:hypothetical protein
MILADQCVYRFGYGLDIRGNRFRFLLGVLVQITFKSTPVRHPALNEKDTGEFPWRKATVRDTSRSLNLDTKIENVC